MKVWHVYVHTVFTIYSTYVGFSLCSTGCYITWIFNGQNGFGFYELSLQKKNNSILNMTKNINIFITSIFYPRLAVVHDHFMTHVLCFLYIVLWCNHCKIHRYLAAPIKQFYGLHRKWENPSHKTPSNELQGLSYNRSVTKHPSNRIS
jgi:hypothetical protein